MICASCTLGVTKHNEFRAPYVTSSSVDETRGRVHIAANKFR